MSAKDKVAYAKLIAAVDTIDHKAAKYLATKAKEVPSFIYDGTLGCCFIFSETSQGFDYWDKLTTKLKHI